MEVGDEIWVRNKQTKKNAKESLDPWFVATIVSKDVNDKHALTMVVKDGADVEHSFIFPKGSMETSDLKPKNDDIEASVENLIDLTHLNEPEILNSLSKRFANKKIYTYTGAILIAINPFNEVIPDESCELLLQSFAKRIKNAAIAPVAMKASNTGREHINESTHSILISGESGSGKTECSKQLMKFLIDLRELDEDDDIEGTTGSADGGAGVFNAPGSLDVMNSVPSLNIGGSPVLRSSSKSNGGNSPRVSKTPSQRVTLNKSGSFYRAFQLSTMDKIKQANPVLDAFGNARTAHTYNSSRVGKYFELSFTGNGDLVGGSISTYLLENVRVTRQLPNERNFHIFYQLLAGANELERKLLALSSIDEYHYTNQGKASINPMIDDEHDFLTLSDQFLRLGFDFATVQRIFSIVAGILHLGNIEFESVSQMEGQVAQIIEKIAGDGTGAQVAAEYAKNHGDSETSREEDSPDGVDSTACATPKAENFSKPENELEAAARLLCLPLEEFEQTLTVRSVMLNKEAFKKHLTPEQAVSAREATAKIVYKRLFEWIVKELNIKLQPTQDIANDVGSSVSILDIFGFDAFDVNSFEQLCINYANEALQQQFNHHIFKLELHEYIQEGIDFENFNFPDNQESLDCIALGVFKILDDQCRIPNPSDKRFFGVIEKDLASNKKFSVSAPQHVLDQFCVLHFAGPVVYTTEDFIEKNLDELPQDTMVLLSHSTNFILSSGSESDGTKIDTIDDAVSPPPKANSGQQRRASHKRTSAPSVVRKFKSELEVMMARINKTMPHYVRCVNPLGRDYADILEAKKATEANSTESNDAIKKPMFNQNGVLEQLRYGGVLEAIRVARSGFPFRLSHFEFFNRYRRLANPLNPITATLPLMLSHDISDDSVRDYAVDLIDALTDMNETSNARTASTLHVQLQSEFLYGNAKKLPLSDWISKIGGLITKGEVQAGINKVFMHKTERSLLESCRFHMLTLCGNKIGNFLLHNVKKTRQIKRVQATNTLLRIARGMLARSKVRMLRQAHKALERADDVPTSDTGRQSSMGFSAHVAAFKATDRLIQEEITKLISAKKVSDDEALLRLDISSAKADLKEYSTNFRDGTVFQVKTLEASEVLNYGYELLNVDKLIPLTTLGKAFSMGRNVKPEHRTASVKSADKNITKDHPLFKTMIRTMDRLKELIDLAKLEKDMLEGRKRKMYHSTTADKEISAMETKLHFINKVASKTRLVYQYFHHYVLQTVREYGNGSTYKNSFPDANQYLLALVTLMEERKPLLQAEKSGVITDPTDLFPLALPSDLNDPRRTGIVPLCTYNTVKFKVAPFAPGLEYSINALDQLLRGNMLMYPIHFIKIVGKSNGGMNTETYYHASTKYGSDNMCPLLSLRQNRSHEHNDYSHAINQVSHPEFSTLFLTLLLVGAGEARPENIMMDFTTSGAQEDNITSCKAAGINLDESFCSLLFNYAELDRAPTSPTCSSGFNVIFTLPQMDEPLAPEVVSLLSASAASAVSIVANWLRDLFLQNRRFLALKGAGFVPSDYANMNVPIRLPVGSATAVYQRLQIVLDKLSIASSTPTNDSDSGKSRTTTHSDLLEVIYPALGKYYAELRSTTSGGSAGVTTADNLATMYQKHHLTHINVANASLGHEHHDLKEEASSNSCLAAFTSSVEELALDFIKSFDFQRLSGLPDEAVQCVQLYESLSFIQTIWLHNINETQLEYIFHGALQAAERNAALHAQLNKDSKPLRVPIQLITKHIVLTGLDESTGKKIGLSHIVRAIRKELAVRVSVGAVEAGSSGHAGAATSPQSNRTPGRTGGNEGNGVKSKQKSTTPGEGKLPLDTNDTELEDMTEQDKALHSRLQYLLTNYANLTHNKTLTEMSNDIVVIKEVVKLSCMKKYQHKMHLIDHKLVQRFSEILLEFPGLSSIGKDLAEKGLFSYNNQHNRRLMHSIIVHPQIDRYVAIILSMLRQTPEFLATKDEDDEFFPCDRIKSLPDEAPAANKRSIKHKLLAMFVNASAAKKVQSGSIMTHYSGEEELIVAAVKYGLPATEQELRDRRYQVDKTGPDGTDTLLMRCVARSKEDVSNTAMHLVNGATTKLALMAIKARVLEESASDHLSRQQADDMIEQSGANSGGSEVLDALANLW